MDSATNGVIAANGEILPDISLDTKPTVTISDAAETARQVVARGYDVNPDILTVSEPELWIYNPTIFGRNDEFTTLVWRMEVKPEDLLPINELVLVDAHRGAVALNFNQIDTARDREVYDTACSSTLPGTLARSEGQGPTGNTDVDDAYDYSGDTYDFYSSEHGRDSIDNAGMTIISTVNYDDDGIGCDYANAYWSGTQMVYGPGYASADDVVAHELTHGVTDYESNLFYYMQSGAINEAFSDIWGEFVDLGNSAGTDTQAVRWLMGEDLPGGAIRDMEDPTAFGDPDRMTSSYYYCGMLDNGGVHWNSGVANKAAYLMAEDGDKNFNGYTITGIGISKTAEVWYEVQTNMLTSAGDYADLYDYLQQAAINLGYSSSDLQEIKDAVDATEMNQQPTSCVATEAPICSIGPPNNLWFDDLEGGAGNWSHAAIVGTSVWYYGSFYATSGLYHLWGNNQSFVSDYYITMTSDVTLPSNAYLHFNHAYFFEPDSYDGGVLEYSINGAGGPWNDAGSLFTHNGYNGTIVTLPNPIQRNPLFGRSAFVNQSNGYISSRVDLSSLSGENVRFRFRIGTDYTGYAYGWFIDDVRIYTCGTDTLISCDSEGTETNNFIPGDTVYVKGSGLPANKNFDLWIQDNPVVDEDPLMVGEDPSTAQESVTTDGSGTFPVTAIWSIPSEAAITHSEYDIIADQQSDGGNTNRFNVASDGIDSATVVGIVAPVPELATTILLGSGLVVVTAYFILRAQHRRRRKAAIL
jgi:hypothetical protein